MAQSLDITKEHCPMTFVKVKLALAKMKPGEELDVALSEGEPLNNVPRTASQEGHAVVSVSQVGGVHHVVIRKGGA